MELSKVKALIEAGIEGAQVEVSGDGSHFDVEVVSSAFEGKSPIQRQRMVMASVKTEIESGELHAISIKARVPG